MGRARGPPGARLHGLTISVSYEPTVGKGHPGFHGLALLPEWLLCRINTQYRHDEDQNMNKTGAQKFRDLLAKGGLIVAPGVYDGYSARLVEAAGFEMAATTGAGISNSLLGIDDIGVMGLSENVTHCRMLAPTP